MKKVYYLLFALATRQRLSSGLVAHPVRETLRAKDC